MRIFVNMMRKIGVTPEMMYMDVGKDVLPSAREFRFPAPTLVHTAVARSLCELTPLNNNSSQPDQMFEKNFPLKAEQLAKQKYFVDRPKIVAAESGCVQRACS
jgi:hypothetical protein